MMQQKKMNGKKRIVSQVRDMKLSKQVSKIPKTHTDSRPQSMHIQSTTGIVDLHLPKEKGTETSHFKYNFLIFRGRLFNLNP